MSDIEVRRYEPGRSKQWDDFVATAKNGHFMFKRDYLEYHADRFEDHSLLFFQKGKMVAIFPANESDGELISHGGLTFGGVVIGRRSSATITLAVFDALIEYARTAGYKAIEYKVMPKIYCTQPADDDLYALFRQGACLVRRDLSTAVQIQAPLPYSSGRKSNLKKAQQADLQVKQVDSFAPFWHLLSDNLRIRHGVSPVHSVDEISLLAARFPQNIHAYEVRTHNGDLLAGGVTYLTDRVVHTQYLSSSIAGRDVGALDLLIDRLLDIHSDKQYLDFGTSTVDEGRTLNTGLLAQKEGFGGRSVVHDFYRLQLC